MSFCFLGCVKRYESTALRLIKSKTSCKLEYKYGEEKTNVISMCMNLVQLLHVQCNQYICITISFNSQSNLNNHTYYICLQELIHKYPNTFLCPVFHQSHLHIPSVYPGSNKKSFTVVPKLSKDLPPLLRECSSKAAITETTRDNFSENWIGQDCAPHTSLGFLFFLSSLAVSDSRKQFMP